MTQGNSRGAAGGGLVHRFCFGPSSRGQSRPNRLAPGKIVATIGQLTACIREKFCGVKYRCETPGTKTFRPVTVIPSAPSAGGQVELPESPANLQRFRQ